MWLVFAGLASALWGISYAISEQLYRHVSIYTTLAINTFALAVGFAVAALLLHDIPADWKSLTTSPRTAGLMVLSIVIYGLAELCIALSITGRNATLAGLIEITYPLFIAIFTYLIFKESEIHIGTAIGGIIIFTGVAVVYWFSR